MRKKLRTLALPLSAVAALGLGAVLLPSYAHDDDGASPSGATHQTSGGCTTDAAPHTHDEEGVPHTHSPDEEGVPHTHDEEGELAPYSDRYDDEGNVIPENYCDTDAPINFGTIDSRAELEAVEKRVDPDGSPDVYVCANLGSSRVKVIAAYPSPPKGDKDMIPMTAAEAAAAGQVPGEAPCEGYSMVVGK